MGADVLYMIPHRYSDGCGLKNIGIDFAVNSKSSLIISIDCGITAVEEAKYAKEKGVDLIVCDHHLEGDTLPDAVAVLDPKRSDCKYPFKDLSACGVGFKLIQGILLKRGESLEDAFEFLDLVALSIAGDIVSVSSENRILLCEGLRRIRNSPRTALKVLADEAKLDLRKCSVQQMLFSIGPRINAAGRMGHARRAVELLICRVEEDALEIAKGLEDTNFQRRQLDRRTFEEAIEMVEKNPQLKRDPAIVLYKSDWHLGVIGIVASRLAERYYKPVILISSVEGQGKGSARSITGFDIYESIQNASAHLSGFGGHAFAAGLSIDVGNVDAFTKDFVQDVGRRLDGGMIKPVIKIDTKIGLSDITPSFWKKLDQFSPFGPGNRRLTFYGDRFKVVGYPSIVGGGHLRFSVADTIDQSKEIYDVIGYNLHTKLPIVRTSAEHGTPISLVFSIQENKRNGQKNLQLCLRDVKLSCDACLTDGC